MPVHVERIKTDVTTVAGDQPWTPEQVEMLVTLVLERLEKRDRDDRADSRLRPSVVPKLVDD
jgi:hypothetical protein